MKQPTPITFFTTLRKENEMTQNELILKTAQVSGVSRKDVEHVLKVAEHVVTVQRDYGDRVNRKNAKIKYTIDRIGVDTFKQEV